MRYGGRWGVSMLLAVGMLALASVARADAGIPMLMLAWPGAWFALLPVILIEAAVAYRVLGLGTRRSLECSALANLVSTLVGIPLAWVVMLLVQFVVTMVASQFVYGAPETWQQRVMLSIFVPFMTPWLPPIEGDEHAWVLPAALMILCVGFFVASAWVEGAVLRKMLPVELHARTRVWSWQANMLSYGAIEAFLLLALIVLARGGKWLF